ncbi:MAG: hypothetical protein OCD01_01955 [Fibrobacterales bacterium]
MKLLVLLTALLTFALITGCDDDSTSGNGTWSCLTSYEGANSYCIEMAQNPGAGACEKMDDTDLNTYTEGTACPSENVTKSCPQDPATMYTYSEESALLCAAE